jgi:hypothetical protein
MSDLTFGWPWATTKRAAATAALMERSGGKCELCGGVGLPTRCRNTCLVIHHERYGSDLTIADLLLLCGRCHWKRHREPDAPKLPAYTPKRRYRRNGESRADYLARMKDLGGKRVLEFGAEEPAGCAR